MSKPLYSIDRWDELYECAQSRKIKGPLSWVKTPTKHDGNGYKRVMRLKNAAAIYAAWMLILQVAAKCPKRGVLFDGKEPLDAEDLAMKTDFPTEHFQEALNILSDNRIGWLVAVEWEHATTTCPLEEIRGQEITGEKRTGDPNCPETPLASSGQNNDVVLEFPCDGPVKSYRLTAAKFEEYRSVYQSVDVALECRKALQWLRDNPTKRKTHSGIPRFLGNWLSNATNNPRGKSADQKSQRLTAAQLAGLEPTP